MPRRKTAEEYDAEIAELKARRRAALAREHSAERKARDHAAFVAGGLLLDVFADDGRDRMDAWKSVDWDRLAAILRNEANRNGLRKRAMLGEPLGTAEAVERLRGFERRDRRRGGHVSAG